MAGMPKRRAKREREKRRLAEWRSQLTPKAKRQWDAASRTLARRKRSDAAKKGAATRKRNAARRRRR